MLLETDSLCKCPSIVSDAKAAEAAASAPPAAAYYNPADPHTMYAPQAPPQYPADMPPPYSEATKKTQ